MLKIILIDDDTTLLRNLQINTENFLNFEKLDACVALVTSKSDKVIEYISSYPNDNYLFFIDINISGNKQAGIELSKKLRELLPFENIVFITSYPELSLVALRSRIKPTDYIVKTSEFNDIMEAVRHNIGVTLKDLESQNNKRNDYFLYKLRGIYQKVNCKEILFFETSLSDSKKIILHSKNKIVPITGSLKKIESYHKKSFFRCHHSFLVNLDNVYAFNRQQLQIYFDTSCKFSCPVSVRKARELTKILKSKTP